MKLNSKSIWSSLVLVGAMIFSANAFAQFPKSDQGVYLQQLHARQQAEREFAASMFDNADPKEQKKLQAVLAELERLQTIRLNNGGFLDGRYGMGMFGGGMDVSPAVSYQGFGMKGDSKITKINDKKGGTCAGCKYEEEDEDTRNTQGNDKGI